MKLSFVALIAATGLFVAGCGSATGVDDWAGGPVTPPPIQITINPSAQPIGDAIATGMVVRDKEMVLYLWNERSLDLMADWRDTKTHEITGEDPVRDGFAGLSTVPSEPFSFAQYDPDDGTVIEVGFLRAPVARLVSEDHGHTVEAKFTRWSQDPSVTIFWLRRAGSPFPPLQPAANGAHKPADADLYPLITAYDASGTILAQGRLRPTGTRSSDG